MPQSPAHLISIVSSEPNGVLHLGQNIQITMTFDMPVTIAGGVPQLLLNDGGVATYDAAASATLNDPTKFVFDYTVGPGDHNVSDLAITTGSLKGATAIDQNGNDANFDGYQTSFPGLAVDTAPIYNFAHTNADTEQTIYFNAINDYGQVVGDRITNSTGASLSFLYSNGVYTPFSGNVPTGINDNSVIVAGDTYYPNLNGPQPFPGPSGSTSVNVTGVNDKLSYVGTYTDAQGVDHAFLEIYGRFQTLQPAGAHDVSPSAVNQNDVVVGTYRDASNNLHSFVFDHGTYSTVVDPDAVGGTTVATGINASGEIVGYYNDGAGGPDKGFVDIGGVFTTIDAQPGLSTDISGVNDAGQIVGRTYDATTGGSSYSFVATIGVDLSTIGFGSQTKLAYTPNADHSGGTVLVYNGTQSASFSVAGQFTASDFHLANDFSGGTYVTDPALTGAVLTAFLSSTPTYSATPALVYTVVSSQNYGVLDHVGQTIHITVTLTMPVTVSGGVPTFALNDGGTAVYDAAASAALNNPAKLVFDYTVGSTDHDVSALAIVPDSLGLNGATVIDQNGHAANFYGLNGVDFYALEVHPAVSNYALETISDPLATTRGTFATGINDLGQIVGTFSDTNKNDYAFYYDSGSFTPLQNGLLVDPSAINDSGFITAGAYIYPDGPTGARQALQAPVSAAYAVDINNHGDMVGWYLDSSSNHRGFTYIDGQYNELIVPGGHNVNVRGISDNDLIVGNYQDANNVLHSFLDDHGTFTTVVDPDAKADTTIATGVNNSGEIVGYYTDPASGYIKGFVDIGGTFSTIDLTTFTDTSGGVHNTIITGVNNAGQLVGYTDSSGAHHDGFVLTPGIDLSTINFGSQTTLAYTPNQDNTGGTISVSDGTHNASIALLGQYAEADFHTATDFHGGTYITDPHLTGAALAAFLSSAHTLVV